jgi:hypothetical protein
MGTLTLLMLPGEQTNFGGNQYIKLLCTKRMFCEFKDIKDATAGIHQYRQCIALGTVLKDGAIMIDACKER